MTTFFLSGFAERPIPQKISVRPPPSRVFLLGIVPTPRSIPNTTFQDLVDAYQEAATLAEVAMVWVEPSGIGQYAKLRKNRVITAMNVYGLKSVVTLNFWSVKRVPGKGLTVTVDAPDFVAAELSNPEFRKLWVQEARMIAKEFKPDYFSLGNEINDYFYLHPGDLDDFVSLYDDAYAEIKKVSPSTKVFVVFSYTHMIDNEQFALLERFDKRVDLIGLTTYPWKHFDNPQEIDLDYYKKIKNYISKPIAFTEIGWISSKEGGSSEEEQAEFLKQFFNLVEDLDLEMVNWLFLHEIKVTGIIASVTDSSTSTISLKNADGSRKKVYYEWLNLYN